MASIHHLEQIPSTPNSLNPVPDHMASSPSPSLTDWSEVDMMSSIESLPLGGVWRNPYSLSRSLTSTPELPPAPFPEPEPSSTRTSDSHHGFVMPSLPRITQSSDDEPVVGFLKVAVCGVKGTAVLKAMASEMHYTNRNVRDDGVDAYTCSSSVRERGNITMLDANFVPKEVPKWIEAQLQSDAALDLVIYALSADGPLEEDLAAMLEIQKLAELVVVMAGSDEEANSEDEAGSIMETECLLVDNCVNNFRKRVWLVSTAFERNWDMTASIVESAGYRSFVPASHNSELQPLILALCSSSGRIRAHAAVLQSRWFQSQLVVTLPERLGTPTHRINLRRKALESIGNIDPLGIAKWSALPKIVSALSAGIISVALGAPGLSALASRMLLRSNQVPPACKRHSLFDIEAMHP